MLAPVCLIFIGFLLLFSIILNSSMLVNEITSSQLFNIAKLANLLVGTQSKRKIATIVRDTVASMLDDDIEISIDTSPNVEPSEMVINAYYDPEADEDADSAIEIVLVFNPTDKVINWSKSGATTFVNELSDALKHELLHATQYRNRNFIAGNKGYDRRNDEYEYMSRPDEIEAYAMNIADELVRKVDVDGALELLRMAKKTAQFKDEMGKYLSPNLMAYFTMFNWDATHPILKRLLKKIYQYISR